MTTISFDVRLRHKDYDAHLRGWHCSALKVPGARVESIHNLTGQIAPANYKVDYAAHTIHFEHWKDPPTDDVTVRLNLARKLSTATRAAWIGFSGTILGAVIGFLANYLLSPPSRGCHHCQCDEQKPVTTADPSPSPSSTATDTTTSTVTDTTTRTTSRTRTAPTTSSTQQNDERPSPSALPQKIREKLANDIAGKPPSGNQVVDPAKTPRPTQ